ncbi:Polypeptide-transport-associated domain protein FtsQ-type [Thalassoporum mexicanum PCC 7367]|uniref:cell division protein FtsQ/DivIB n=1 Tax=Thalassoporum mexicanum TaxID=3457544 RepID=UPI00029FB949|nr:FtsQ-type POTRA domain-containing protein [Pseudanabaena sp. PCC 7367]AFY69365.1 Polypeptide-transport-associated domain protein FtsQ-type [Pseudanabaena sp. PCC 7367]
MRSWLSLPYPNSEDDFVARRKQIRQKRRLKFFQHMWQIVFISSATTGLVWLASLPDLKLDNSSQIDIEGNKLLTRETLQDMVPVSYPQHIFWVKPHEIAEQLEKTAPVKSVEVQRTLFPSKLTVIVEEREPVARALQFNEEGLLDENGAWMPLHSYPSSIDQPQLTILGFDQQVAEVWAEAYDHISNSPVKITQVDWRDKSNLILITELGTVHCGIYKPNKLARQLKTLDRLRKLDRVLDPESFLYLDLSDPNSPVLEMLDSAKVDLSAIEL